MRWSLILCFALALPAQASWPENWSAQPAWPEPYSLAAGSALTLTSLALRHPTTDAFQNYEASRRPLGPWSKYGDWAGQLVPNALYAAGMSLSAWQGQTQNWPRTQLMIMATAEAVLITTVLKYTIREERPDSSQRNSFPSGHTTSAFAFAAVVGAEHGWRWGAPAYLLAGFVGWSRINDNKHFLHDVLGGATIGLSTGLGVYYAQQKKLGQMGRSEWQVFPIVLNDGGEIMLQRGF